MNPRREWAPGPGGVRRLVPAPDRDPYWERWRELTRLAAEQRTALDAIVARELDGP